jgi:hypothetical protein
VSFGSASRAKAVLSFGSASQTLPGGAFVQRVAWLLISVAAAGCATIAPPRYLVTKAPFEFLSRHPGFCVAVDPSDPQGVWWWEPGRDGCASRSTGPVVIRGDRARVARLATGEHDVHFEIQLMTGTPLQVDLRLVDAELRWVTSDVVRPVERRPDLTMPESAPPSRTSR